MFIQIAIKFYEIIFIRYLHIHLPSPVFTFVAHTRDQPEPGYFREQGLAVPVTREGPHEKTPNTRERPYHIW